MENTQILLSWGFSQRKPRSTGHSTLQQCPSETHLGRNDISLLQRSQENSSLFARTISMHPKQFPAAFLRSSRMWKTHHSPNAFDLPKKGCNPTLHKELTPFPDPRPASTRDREFPASDRTERIKIPNAFPWRNQPSVIQRPFQEENQARIWEVPPIFVLGNHRQELRGDGEVQNQRKSTPNQIPKIYVQIQSRAKACPAPAPAGGALLCPPGNAALPYPSPTSRDIITTKPRMEVQDANFPLPLVCASGMMSSITT